ncbi:hypothetical protein [Streptomyces sp. NPDC001642]|uniref:hypothetical protein n=1 Tax=Streptomyces sp. NPDC001642 TaxID=3154392 RepID=UPI003331B7AD
MDLTSDGTSDGPHVLRIGGRALVVPAATAGAATGSTARVPGTDGLVSRIDGLTGLPNASLARGTDSNALGERSAAPYVESDGPVSRATAYVAAIHLGGAEPAVPPRIESRVEGDALLVEVIWLDDTTDVVHLPAPDLPQAGLTPT